MGRNIKERQAYLYLHSLIDKVSIKLHKKWRHDNWDIGEFRALRKSITEKIINKETKITLTTKK